MVNRKDTLQVPGANGLPPALAAVQQKPENLLRSPKSSRGRPRNPSAGSAVEQNKQSTTQGREGGRGKRGKRGEQDGIVGTLWRDLRGQSWFVPVAVGLAAMILGLLFLAISQTASASTRDATVNRVVLQPQSAANTQAPKFKKRQPTSRPKAPEYNPFAVPFKPKPKPQVVRPVIPNPKKVEAELKEGEGKKGEQGEGFKSESGGLSGRAAAVLAKGYEDEVLERPVNPKAAVVEGEKEELPVVQKSRTYEELKEAMKGFEDADLTGVLNAAYRGVVE